MTTPGNGSPAGTYAGGTAGPPPIIVHGTYNQDPSISTTNTEHGDSTFFNNAVVPVDPPFNLLKLDLFVNFLSPLHGAFTYESSLIVTPEGQLNIGPGIKDPNGSHGFYQEAFIWSKATPDSSSKSFGFGGIVDNPIPPIVFVTTGPTPITLPTGTYALELIDSFWVQQGQGGSLDGSVTLSPATATPAPSGLAMLFTFLATAGTLGFYRHRLKLKLA